MPNGTAVNVRAIRPGDRPFLAHCAPFIQATYPGGDVWLDRRLDDILIGRGRGVLATVNGRPAGFAISTDKGEHREKLSTLFVHPAARHLGCGRRLIGALGDLWCLDDVRDAYVTCPAGDRTTQRFFERQGFVPVAVIQDRYGPHRDEAVLNVDVPQLVGEHGQVPQNGAIQSGAIH
jgi:GNAT superfamily N-acetyltransferase